MCRTEPLFPPAHVGETEVMPPVVRFQHHGPLRRRKSIDAVAGAVEHESECRPRLAELRIETTGLTRVMGGHGQRGRVGRRTGARHLELHHAGIGQPNMCRRVLRHTAQRVLEHITSTGNLVGLEGFERRPPFDERAMRREQRNEPGVTFTRCPSRHGDGETIATPRNGLDVGAARMCAKTPAQARDGLLERVVAHRHVLPSRFQQVVLGDDLAGTSNEQVKNVQLSVGKRDGFCSGGQAPSSRIQLEGSKNKERAARHGLT